MKIIIDKGLFNMDAASKISGYSSLEEMIKSYTPDKVSEITGLTEEELTVAAETFANAPKRLIAMTFCVSENNKGLSSALAAANLLILLGEGPSSLQIAAGQCNTYGMLEVGIVPSEGTKGAVDMLYKPGSLKALYIMGEDPVVNLPDSGKIKETLKSIDFLIVQDIDMTETAKLAHVVLPASSWAEKNGSFMNAEGLMQKIHKVVETTGQSLPDWMILRNLGLSMGADLGVKSLDDLTKEVEGLISQKEKGDVKPTFRPTSYEPEEAPDSEFAYTLVTRDVLQHSGNMSTRSESLRLVSAEPVLEMNKKDAEKHAIIDEEHVKITSRRGSVYLRAKVTDTVPEGVVVTSVHFPHGGLNELTHLSTNGAHRLDAVKIEK